MKMKTSEIIIPENVEKNIQAKSKQFVKTYKINSSDLDDIEQDLRWELIKNIPKHNPEKSLMDTFCDRIIKRKLSKIARKRYALKNTIIRCANPLEEGDEGNNNNPNHELNIAFGESLTWQAQDLKCDIDSLLENLPEKLKIFCNAVIAEKSLSAVAKLFKINKHALYKEYLTPLRKVCSEKKLQDYLKNPDRFKNCRECIR